MAGFLEAVGVENLAAVLEHARAAAQHEAILFQIELRQADVGKQLAVAHQVGQAALVAERLAGNRRVVDQLFTYQIAEVLVIGQHVVDQILIGQVADVAAAVSQDHLVVLLVGFRVLDDADKRRQTGTGAEQIQVAARDQVIQHQRAGGLAADHDLVACIDVLQARGQRAIRHLDAEELQRVFVVRAGDAVGAHQRAAFDFQTDHDEVTVLETETGITGGPEAEQSVCPVVHAEYFFGVEA